MTMMHGFDNKKGTELIKQCEGGERQTEKRSDRQTETDR